MAYTAHTPSNRLSSDEDRQVRDLANVVECLEKAILAKRLAVHPRYAAG